MLLFLFELFSYSRSTTTHIFPISKKGYYRDVWVTNDYDDATYTGGLVHATNSSHVTSSTTNTNNKIVLKTLRYEHEFDLRNWDRHRRDAIAMERLSASPFVLDIYASCGNSGLTEYAPGGSIRNAVFPRRPKRQQQNTKHEQQHEPKRASKIERLQMGMCTYQIGNSFRVTLFLLCSYHVLLIFALSQQQPSKQPWVYKPCIP